MFCFKIKAIHNSIVFALPVIIMLCAQKYDNINKEERAHDQTCAEGAVLMDYRNASNRFVLLGLIFRKGTAEWIMDACCFRFMSPFH